MFFYNTFSKKKEEFTKTPNRNEKIRIYSCGPTVYNFIHIGNARPLCVFDVLRRFLKYMDFELKFVQNFTDIDDKIINKAKEEDTDFIAISKKYIKEFKIDSEGLNILEADVNPLATETINEIIKMIEILIEKKHAYKTENNDVCFRTRTFKDYGKLSNQSIDDLESGARIEPDEKKEDPLDFVLWKHSKENEPYWESPWGKGRPGWHIECSAMVYKFLGETIDFHCGGQDLIFPHHENEIAQSECANGKKFCKFWLHNGYININSKKMSKSSNNFFTVREISEQYGYEPIRFFLISSHYRSPIDYSEETINQAKNSLERLYNFKQRLVFNIENKNKKNIECNHLETNDVNLKEYEKKFLEALGNDLNTAEAISVIFDLVKAVNIVLDDSNSKISNDYLKEILFFFNKFVQILGILYTENKNISLTDEVQKLIDERENARKNKDYKTADEKKKQILEKGITIEDTLDGPKIRF